MLSLSLSSSYIPLTLIPFLLYPPTLYIYISTTIIYGFYYTFIIFNINLFLLLLIHLIFVTHTSGFYFLHFTLIELVLPSSEMLKGMPDREVQSRISPPLFFKYLLVSMGLNSN